MSTVLLISSLKMKRKLSGGDVQGDEEATEKCSRSEDEKVMKKNRVISGDETDTMEFDETLIPKRLASGELVFKDYPQFRPNLTPEEMIRMGSFGGTYFRPIYSSIVNRVIEPDEAMRGLPGHWFEGLDKEKMVYSSDYNNKVNKYKVKCGQGLKEWEMSGWITPYDPYGWFQWYCRFYLGRRCPDDERQVKRGIGVMGEKGRWRQFLAKKCLESGKPIESALDDYSISPKVRQLLQHWGYAITKDALKKAKQLSRI